MATSKNTKMAHIVNLMSIAGIDGNIEDAERNVIIKIAQDLGLTEADFEACIEAYQQIDESELETIVPEDDDDKYEFLKNMVLVMMVDGEIDDNERAYIAGLAEQFGVDGEEAVNELIQIVYDEYFAEDEDSEEDDDEDDEESDTSEADAYAEQARMVLFGYAEESSLDAYNELLDKALNEGSPIGMKMRLEDMVYGRNDQKQDPKRVIDFLENDILNDDDNGVQYPYLYEVLGDAYNKIGNKAKAAECYETASDYGYKEAAYKQHAVKLEGLNSFAKEMYETVIDMECDDDKPGCFTLRAQLLAEKYEEQDAAERKKTAKKIVEALEHDHELGFGEAATKLGDIYYLGKYGVKRDMEMAWNWYYHGVKLEDADAFRGLARMVKDGNGPDVPDGFLDWCEISAERRGKGAPDKHYLAIIKPDGNAVAYNFIKDDWDKVAGYIGAKRLAPMRVNAHKNLTVWVDIEAPRKGLPMNVVGKKFLKGVICGDIVLTQTDDIWDPMLFMDLDELNETVESLGGKLVQVINDELALGKEKRKYAKLNADLLHSESGFVARIQPDNTAHIVDSNHKMFALVEEDIYDPIRLESLYKIGEKLGLKGRLTIWTDNSALRKQMIMYNKNEMNPIGTKIFPGPVADNFFVAMEDENYNIMLFDDAEELKKVVVALGVKPANVVID